ncbi:uncharacterized protein LOC133821459 [Humulus lupulus]|uniref:uncharacterized protein LOC133821459 n=1 Tax=Humulus lupulus TaxID=3486 RepID=UPI002B408F2F|nr:uncharacterized protein LOC133821459 [Humulus lupulus]
MGQSLLKFAPGSEQQNIKLVPTIERCYEKHFKTKKDPTVADFYRAVCETVEDINKELGNTQFTIPTAAVVDNAYSNDHQNSGPVTKEQFQTILKKILTTSAGFTGLGGAKDTFIYVFGVPIVTLFLKQSLMPRVIRNEFFIPGVTSATVFVLAKLNKI